MATSDLLQPQALKPQADMLASQGRFGDTQMVHMSMPEIRAMESQMGQELPINPVTGAKEAFAWLPAAVGATVGSAVLGGMAAESGARDQTMYSNLAQQQNTADRARAYEAMQRNMGSVLPYGMFGFDTGVAQPAVMGAFLGQGLGDTAKELGAIIANNALQLQTTQQEVDSWLAANPEPPVEIRRKSGFLGFGGKQWTDSSKRDAWAQQKKAYIEPRKIEVARLTNENQQLSVRRSAAELGELEGVSAPYQPMFTAGREALSDVFTGDMLDRELAVTDPVRIQRLRQAEAMIQAQKTGLAGSLNQQLAMNQARRGYGGDSLFTNLSRARTEGAAAQQAAASRMGAETANIGDVARMRANDINRALTMRGEPFRQLGLEMEAKIAPQTYAANLMQDRLGLLNFYKTGQGNYQPMKSQPFAAIPSPGTLGLKSASGLMGSLGSLAMGAYGQQQATAAANAGLLRDAQMMKAYSGDQSGIGGDWGFIEQMPGYVKPTS